MLNYKMTITSAKYGKGQDDKNSCIKATIDGVEMFVPIDEANTHYAEIKRQVDAGELTIEDAD
jgi:hypothetical protein